METAKSLGRPLGSNYSEEEVQGLQGPIAIPELILQKIWLRKDFFFNQLICHSKKRIQILNPGRWNQFEGPDFKEAELIIDGQKVVGDVEIHFHPNDWFKHGHDDNPNFSDVILHVTLFEPAPEHPPVFTTFGFCPETLVLLPYLKQGLEEYAVEDALLKLENRDSTEFIQAFINKPEFEIKQLLLQKAKLRWQEKCAFALARIRQDGFENTCHQMVLETLGYRRNRTPMNAIGINYPLQSMIENLPSVEELIDSQKEKWKLAKLRPANHPRKRLQQYLNLIKKNPGWPAHWMNYIERFVIPKSSGDTLCFRKDGRLAEHQSTIKNEILAETISGTRFHTLVIDALLPLASAQVNKDLFDLWFHWYPGDIPSAISIFLNPTAIINKNQPSCNGLNQGVLQLLIESQLI